MPSLRVERGVIYPTEIDRILKMPGGPVGVEVRRLCLDIAAEAEAQSRVKSVRKSPYDAPRSGRYVRSWAVKVHTNSTTGFEYVVENTAPYSAVLEEGSRPHMIEARNKRWLRFRSRATGQWVTVKAVKHPGMVQGWHVLRDAMYSVVRSRLDGVR